MADLGVKKVIKIALMSRLFSLIVQSLSNNLIADYDTSEEHHVCQVNISDPTSKKQISVIDQVISSSFGGLSKWDAVYFLDIAQHGYQYEQNMAFFPFLPLCMFSFGKILKPVQLLLKLSDKSVLLLSIVIINAVAFTLAAVGLYHLTRTIFHNSKLARRAVILFCFNPASVFFSAAYSEAIFAMTQFWGMLILEVQPRNYLAAAVVFSFGAGTRSNGIISCGFIGYKFLQDIVNIYLEFKKTKKQQWTMTRAIGLKIIKMISLFLIIVSPFLLFQYYGYTLYCQTPRSSPWCDSYLPLSYFYIQRHYWNVGFLKYYELKQLPNFLLAMPVVIISVLGIWEYLRRQTKNAIWCLGLVVTKKSNPLNIFVFVIHLGFMLALGVTSMHIQVVTRFITSSSPMIYWIAVSWTTPRIEEKNIRSNAKENFIYVFFLLYYCLGHLLHCNFYPWT